jgi:hypothetical protein
MKEGITIHLTKEASEEIFFNALCNGLGYIETSYGLELRYDEEQYKQAVKLLKDKANGVLPCYEDAYMQILRSGGTLTLVDLENGEEPKTIKLADVHEWVQKTDSYHLQDYIDENDDAVTADVVLQTVFYHEVIFG